MTDLSPALRRRLPAYFRTLIRLYGMGKERISSDELAAELGLVPSQVRTDMKAIGCCGQRSYGYGIPALYKTIAGILQLSDKFSAVMVGSTHLAKAIAETPVFMKRGVKLTSVFTENGCVDGFLLPQECAVHGISDFDTFFKLGEPDIVILACASSDAQRIFGLLEALATENVKNAEVWNFTDLELKSEILKVKNIHMPDYLMMLCLDVGK